MIALLLLFATLLVVWRLSAPGERFLPAFADLLAGPSIRRGPLAFLSGRSDATGAFRDREVAIRLQLKRSRYALGYLVLAMRIGGTARLTDAGIEARTRDEAGRRALSALAAHELKLGAEDGWLKAQWKPQGFVIFPGRFSPARWRGVLDALHTVARSLEAAP